MTQTARLAPWAAAGGSLSYRLAGWLGGWKTEPGYVRVSLTFLDRSGHQAGAPVTLRTVTRADRDGRTGFLGRAMTGAVPPGTASIQVGARFLDSSTPPGGEPEPSGPGGGMLGHLSLTVSAPQPRRPAAPAAVGRAALRPRLRDHDGEHQRRRRAVRAQPHAVLPQPDGPGRHAGQLPRRVPPQRRELPGHRGRRQLRPGRHLLAGHQRPAPEPRRRARGPGDDLEGLRAGHGLPVQRPRVHRVHATTSTTTRTTRRSSTTPTSAATGPAAGRTWWTPGTWDRT